MQNIIGELGLTDLNPGVVCGRVALEAHGEILESISPNDGRLLGRVRQASASDYELAAAKATDAFRAWRMIPAPGRGEIVRRIGLAVRERKRELGALVSLEAGKIRAEAEGEVQEVIDICDFAVGLSRMLYGLTMPSERPGHRMFEQWHPLGPVGVITAFNFPAAVWAWNAMIALVAGDTVIWKPSSKTPLTALALNAVIGRVLEEDGLPEGIMSVVIGNRREVGRAAHRGPPSAAHLGDRERRHGPPRGKGGGGPAGEVPPRTWRQQRGHRHPER